MPLTDSNGGLEAQKRSIVWNLSDGQPVVRVLIKRPLRPLSPVLEPRVPSATQSSLDVSNLALPPLVVPPVVPVTDPESAPLLSLV